MSLREAIRLAIIGDGTHPWADRVVEMQGNAVDVQAGGPPAELPFVMVKYISDDPMSLAYEPRGSTNAVNCEVWPHSEESTWTVLDALGGQLIPILAPRIILDPESGRRYLSAYAGSPLMDSPARSWDAYSRPIRFTITTVAWMTPMDSRAQALATWTAGEWPGLVQVDPQTWDPQDARPGVYFEPRSAYVPNAALSTMGMDVYDEILAVRVIAPTHQARVDWTERVAAAMRRARVPYDGINLSPEVQSVNLQADPMTDGQITIRVPFRVLTESFLQAESPLRVAHVVDTQGATMDVP